LTASAGTGLARQQVSVSPGSRFGGTAGPGGELWFVIAGAGQLDAGGLADAALDRHTGVWLPPGTGYRLLAGPAAEVRVDQVSLPADPAPAGPAGTARLSRLRDCEVERTGDRRFRVLLGPGRGCEAATQFLGEIPPGRAPEHTHPYNEVVLVLDGAGVLHAGGTAQALARGTSVHLPPGLPHCLENTGTTTLMVLGVFHPGGSPAQKAAG
jgi:quercetin dioxygenase-like cupin family protein